MNADMWGKAACRSEVKYLMDLGFPESFQEYDGEAG